MGEGCPGRHAPQVEKATEASEESNKEQYDDLVGESLSVVREQEPIKKFVFGLRLGDSYIPLRQEKEDSVRVFTAERVGPAKESHLADINEKAKKHNRR